MMQLPTSLIPERVEKPKRACRTEPQSPPKEVKLEPSVEDVHPIPEPPVEETIEEAEPMQVDEVVVSIEQDLGKTKTLRELKQMCVERGIDTTGKKKTELVALLSE